MTPSVEWQQRSKARVPVDEVVADRSFISVFISAKEASTPIFMWANVNHVFFSQQTHATSNHLICRIFLE